jgi:ribosomal protein S6--L-glutamate ligase
MDRNQKRISLGKRLRTNPSFHCVGTFPNWQDYPAQVKRAIRDAHGIHYPSSLYDDLFHSLGKDTFPSNFYRFMGNKIRQSELFQLLDIPHPRTRIYYGGSRSIRILQDFPLPFVAKTPVGSSQGTGVWLVHNVSELSDYLKCHQPAYIQQYLPIDRDLRVVIIAGQAVHYYWRVQKPGDFRNNVTQGARICYKNVPDAAIRFALRVAGSCNFGEVGLDICLYEGSYYVLEANMVYGLEGFRQAGLNIQKILAQL